jgi:type II secretory pathway component PulL
MTIITFYGFIEFLAYGTAFTESIVFTYSIFKKKSRIESRWLIISIAAVAILLLIAATIEYMLIQFFGQIYPNLEELPAKI